MEEIIYYNWEQQDQAWNLYNLKWEDFQLIVYIGGQVLDGLGKGYSKRQSINQAVASLDERQKDRLLRLCTVIMGKEIKEEKVKNEDIRVSIDEVEITLDKIIQVKVKIA